MALLTVKDLEVRYPENGRMNTVCRMSLEVNTGETVGIVGASGCGKSSAMLGILGLLPPEAKMSCTEIRLGEENLTPPDTARTDYRKKKKEYEKKMEAVRGKKIAMIFQDPSACLNPLVRVGRQITETIRCHRKCTSAQARERAEELLDMAGFHDPAYRMNQYPFELSGGMKQRVVIAMALACEPDLIIADEPTTALDVTVQRQILDLLVRIRKRTKTAMLIVSHDMGVIASLCGKVIVMQSGEVVETGTAEEIFYHPSHAYTCMLVDKAVKSGSGYMDSGVNANTVVLKADNIGRIFKERTGWRKTHRLEALDHITFEIRKGETFGLVGESGCGKTTLARVLTGILQPSTGKVHSEGRVQMIFQNPYSSFDPRYTVEQILEEPLVNEKKELSERKKIMEDMLRMTGMEIADLHKRSDEFSGGQRQRIAIARALMTQPDVLICDEPLSALDVSMQSQILELLMRIQKETGVSYLFISHDLNAVRRISSRIGVMYRGMIVEAGNTEEICEDPWHPYTKQLLSAVLFPDPVRMKKRKRFLVREETVKQDEMKEGCPYAPQCGYALERCRKEKPRPRRFGSREISCFLYSEEHTSRRTDDPMISQI